MSWCLYLADWDEDLGDSDDDDEGDLFDKVHTSLWTVLRKTPNPCLADTVQNTSSECCLRPVNHAS